MTRRTKHKKPETQTLIDIVIVTGGRFDMLEKCLLALEKQNSAPPFSVILVDNATDQKERTHYDNLLKHPIIAKSKRLTQEVGYPISNNEGARMGNSPLILFLNDDVELMPDALNMLVRTLDDSSIGIVGAKLLFPPDSPHPHRPAGKTQHVGLAMDIKGDVIHPLVGWSANHPKCCISRDVIGVTGACLMIRRNLFRQANGFDLEYTWGTYEDVSLCFFVRSLGKRVVVNVDAQGYHYTGATAEKKQRGYPLQQNALIFKAKWAQSGLFEWTDYRFY